MGTGSSNIAIIVSVDGTATIQPLRQINMGLLRLSGNATMASKSVETLNRRLSTMSRRLVAVRLAARSFFAILAIIPIIQAADAIERLNSRLITLTGSQDGARMGFDRLRAAARAGATSVNTIGQRAVNFVDASQSRGVNRNVAFDQVEQITGGLNNAFGRTGEQAAQVLNVLAQTLIRGGTGFRIFQPLVAEGLGSTLADAAGVSTSELQDLFTSNASIDNLNDFIANLADGVEELGEEAVEARMGVRTLRDSIAGIRQGFEEFADEFTGDSPLAENLQEIIDAVALFVEGLAVLASAINRIITFIRGSGLDRIIPGFLSVRAGSSEDDSSSSSSSSSSSTASQMRQMRRRMRRNIRFSANNMMSADTDTMRTLGERVGDTVIAQVDRAVNNFVLSLQRGGFDIQRALTEIAGAITGTIAGDITRSIIAGLGSDKSAANSTTKAIMGAMIPTINNVTAGQTQIR